MLIYGVIDYHQNAEREKREQAERVLSECWQQAVSTGVGADLCKALADSLHK